MTDAESLFDMTLAQAPDGQVAADLGSESLTFGRDAELAGTDGEVNAPPFGGGMPDGGLGNAPDGERDTDGRGGGEGTDGGDDGVPCRSGIPMDIFLTDASGFRAPVPALELRSPEDGGGDFGLGLGADAWPESPGIELEVLHQGQVIAQRVFSPVLAQCGDDQLWSVRDLRLSPLPSVEIDDIIDAELQVQGSLNVEAGGGPIRFEGTIRLQY